MTQPPMVKAIALLARKEGTTHEEFVRHWVEVHAPMAHGIPAVKRYHLNFIVAEPTRSDVPGMGLAGGVDGIAELWFESEEAYREYRRSDAAQRWLADGATFIGRGQSFLCTEQVVVP